MATITRKKIRATVSVGGYNVDTPYIQSFSVTRSRSQPATFQASLKIPKGRSISAGADVRISAGVGSPSNAIFTGTVSKASISPCWDDPGYVLLNISGADALSRLEGKKYTRRCRLVNDKWATITGVIQPAYKEAKFKFDFRKKFVPVPSDLDTRSEVVASRPTTSVLDAASNAAPAKNPDDRGGPSIYSEHVDIAGEL